MTIKTLEYIHTLLQEKVAQTEEIYKSARKQQHALETRAESEVDSLEREGLESLAEDQGATADRFHSDYLTAFYALQDFENHEW